MSEERTPQENSQVNGPIGPTGNPGEPGPTPAMTAEQYLQKLQEIRAGTVPREEYDRLARENRILVAAAAQQPSMGTGRQDRPSRKDLIEKVTSGKQLSNLEYAEAYLAIREDMLENGEEDPMYGVRITSVTADDERVARDSIERVVKVLQHCVEVADGDSSVFDTEFQKNIVNDPVAMPGRKRG